MSKQYKCQIPVLSHDEYMAVCKRAGKNKEPYPAREFEEQHKLKPHGDYYEICSVCDTVVFKEDKEVRKIRARLNRVDEEVVSG